MISNIALVSGEQQSDSISQVYIYICLYMYIFLIAELVKNLPAMQETRFNSWVRKICWGKDRLPTPVFLGFPCGSVGKESACNVGDLGLIPGLGICPGGGHGSPLQYSCLENPMGREARWATVHWVTKSRTRLKPSACTH